jgi:hypothetical protein
VTCQDAFITVSYLLQQHRRWHVTLNFTSTYTQRSQHHLHHNVTHTQRSQHHLHHNVTHTQRSQHHLHHNVQVSGGILLLQCYSFNDDPGFVKPEAKVRYDELDLTFGINIRNVPKSNFFCFFFFFFASFCFFQRSFKWSDVVAVSIQVKCNFKALTSNLHMCMVPLRLFIYCDQAIALNCNVAAVLGGGCDV